MARLVVLTEGFAGRACELKAVRTTIGRLEDNAFQIPEPSVSSHHCEVQLRGQDIIVKDLDSTNGTYVDGEPVTETLLKPGQVLRLGQVEIRLEEGTSGSAAAIPAVAQSTKMPVKPAAITQGVKISELDTAAHPVSLGKDTVFRKKTDQVNRVFIIGLIALGAIVIALLILAVLKASGS
jgi:pSer/pThr/pTyr-binding forkhead associated (FHA) protein